MAISQRTWFHCPTKWWETSLFSHQGRAACGVLPIGATAMTINVPHKSSPKSANLQVNSVLQGLLCDWNDDKGFGFIVTEPDQHRVFFHISDYIEMTGRPVNGMGMRFTLQRHAEKRQWRATEVMCVSKPPKANQNRDSKPQRRSKQREGDVGDLPHIVVALLVGLVWVLALSQLSMWLVGWCALLSVVSFVSYQQDKQAALQQRWRVPEKRLHSLDIWGGWPGGLLARQIWRHKTSKTTFVVVFWITVLVNVLATVWLWHKFAQYLPLAF